MPNEAKIALAQALCRYYRNLTYQNALSLIKHIDSGKLFTYFRPEGTPLH
jgi:hypothetical protein